MHETHIPLLIVSGPIGVGKTTVGQEVSTILDRRGISHSFVDIDALAQTYPRPTDDLYASRLALLNLQTVWRNAKSAGARNLILSRVIETEGDRTAIEDAIPNCRSVLCRLRASADTLLERVLRREVGVGYDWHATRAQELARLMERAPADFVIDTDARMASDIAAELAGKVAWHVEKP
jgi:deoxyadenosine/deoxycytidine kinase